MTFDFHASQPEVIFGVTKFQAGHSAEFAVTVSNDGGTTFTAVHDYFVNQSSPSLDIKASDFGLTSINVIHIEKIADPSPPAGIDPDDNQVDIGTIQYNSSTTINGTTLNFTLGVTDGDGDHITNSTDTLLVSLLGTGSALTGANGNPEVIAASPANDIITGGTGLGDTVDYSHATSGVTVNLSAETDTIAAGVGGGSAGDTIKGIENVFGSSFNDTLTSVSTGSVLDGGANSTNGTDTLTGGAANDVLIASRLGVDSLTGNGGNDTFVLQGGTVQANIANVTIQDFVSGTDGIVVDVADQALTISNAALINAATQFNSGGALPTNGGPAWAEGPGTADKFYFDTTNNDLWYSAAGTGADQVKLAHLSTGVAATDVHVA